MASAWPLRRIAASISPAWGPSPQRTRSHEWSRTYLVAIMGESLDQSNKVLLGGEAANRQVKRRSWHALLCFGMIVPVIGLSAIKCVINGVIAKCDAIGLHSQINQVVAMGGPPTTAASKCRNRRLLINLLPPGSRSIDRLTLGHQDRRPAISPAPAGRSHGLWPGIAGDSYSVGLIAVEGPDDGRGALGGCQVFENSVRVKGDPVKRFGLFWRFPRIGAFQCRPSHMQSGSRRSSRNLIASARSRADDRGQNW